MIKRQRHKIVRCERGETMVSYVLIVALIALICVPMTRQVSWGVGNTACKIYQDGDYIPGFFDGEACWNDPYEQLWAFWPENANQRTFEYIDIQPEIPSYNQ